MLRELFINFSIMVTLTTVGNMLINAKPEPPKTWHKRLQIWAVMILSSLIIMQFALRLDNGVIMAFHAMSPVLAGLYGGIGWALVVALPVALYRVTMGGPTFVATLYLLAAAVSAGLIQLGAKGFSLPWRQIAWRALVIFGVANLSLVLEPGHGTAMLARYWLRLTLSQSVSLLLCVWIIRMRFESQQHLQHVTHLASTDPLTGLQNLRSLEIALRETSPSTECCFLLLDLDEFKQVNDGYGHVMGDEVLRQIADLLRQQMRYDDVVCRYGGEEFAILMRHCPLAKGKAVAERIRSAVANYRVTAPEGAISVTLSGGLIAWQPECDLRHHFAAADKLLYAAKELGRNRVLAASEVA